MKQLLLTIPFKSECDSADFLAESTHSPQWLGDPAQWKIVKMNVHSDAKGKKFISALLENENWLSPEVKALNASEIYERVKALPRSAKVYVGMMTGVRGRHTQTGYSFISGLISCGGYNGFAVDRGKLGITLGDLLSALNIEEKYASGDETVDSIVNAMNETNRAEMEQWLASTPAAIAFIPYTSILYPVTDILIDASGEVTVIYYQDTKIDCEE